MSTIAPADSCLVRVTVHDIGPYPLPRVAGPLRPEQFGAHITVRVGPMVVDGVAVLAEGPDGQLHGIELDSGERANEWLPAQVLEVLADLDSPALTSRICAMVVAAVQQYDRDRGPLGDGPEVYSPDELRDIVTFAAGFGVDPVRLAQRIIDAERRYCGAHP